MSHHEQEHEQEHKHGNSIKIEAGQILNPDCFPPPNELVCIQVPKVFDQVALRECITRSVNLTGGNKNYNFEGASDFDITNVTVISSADSLSKPGFKKLKLFVQVKYTIYYSDTNNCQFKITDYAGFNLTVNEIYCPSCVAQIGVIKFPKPDFVTKTKDEDGVIIKVEALVEAFHDVIDPCDVLSIDIGGFFIVKCECVVQLLIPAYGYCPVPPEQGNISALNCHIFNNKELTPFPTSFFPNQKYNPLDEGKKDDWDD